MKVLVFDRCSTDVFNDSVTVEMIPDSAIIKDGKPFFVPAVNDSWRYSCGVAVRICRLGKNISEKFATRYIDAYAPCVTTVPSGISGFNALNRCHEGAIILGEWQPADVCPGKFTFRGDGILPKEVAVDCPLAAKMVSLAARRGVMKIGDILVMNEDELAENIPAGQRVTAIAENNDGESLKFVIK